MQPYRLKHLTLRNRLMSTAHEPAYSEDGMPKARYRAYHAEKAKGGIALTVACGSAVVSEDSPEAFGNLHAWKDEITPWVSEMADAVHEHGAAIMMQITHLGRRTGWNKGGWLPVLAPSPVREPAHRAFPKEMEDWDIERVIADYADAAERLQAAGLDGLEFEAYGHLIDQFWSPATNFREDDWGGALENRLAFGKAVVAAVRRRVGPEFILGMRLAADEDWARGFDRDTGEAIAKQMIATGDIDFLNLIRGHIDTDVALEGVIPVHGSRANPHLDFCGEIRAATRFPVFHAARIADVATARHAVAEGKLDMVGMTRAHIAEPHITAKILAGQEHRIRPCVGATYCLDRIYEGGEALCIHNASTGREESLPHEVAPADAPKTAVVVGAGPGGLEAARVLALRGHAVTVFEAADAPGGQVALLSRLARRREMIGIIDWRMSECEALGVQFRFNTYAEAEEVTALSPDIVVVATGGMPNTEVIEGVPLPGAQHVISGWDILSGAVKPAAEVLLFDDHAGHPGLTTAEAVCAAGSALEIVSPERFFAVDVGGLNHAAYARALDRAGARITISKRLRGVERQGNRLIATLGSDFSDRVETREVDQVIVEHGTLPLDELYHALRPLSRNRGAVDVKALLSGRPQAVETNPQGAFTLWRIGDAVAARNIHAAVLDAFRLCRLA
ncbi:NADH:flavin oxidoreductase [Paroceanicella profunda]|uniref:NADH:flavin oxidoreductase n=1 Tax=Paroceanicella profunda TaxID=2579971 RepID=A0A5B8G497_9RHOB|nr:NADH:flavin oxidoreductase [Paroceanicella profunda]QDL93713.1 NADH:flavin oxidoreductase [Paroceanicella profunda]